MKYIIKITFILYFLVHTTHYLNAQIAINSDGSSPDASSMLDITSTDKGILIPRMTTSERNNISNPATGLMIYDNGEKAFWYYDGTNWSAVGNSVLTSENGVTFSKNSTDDFVFGVDSINYGGSGTETKFFFDKSKGAFRIGSVNDSLWNVDSLGINSFATGYNSKATGDYSTALGYQNTASGYLATTFGNNNEASGNYSMAFGHITVASGAQAISFGTSTKASGEQSIAFGSSSTASGYYSTAFGYNTTASNQFSTSFGYNTAASGVQSTAFGYNTTASGYNATTFGSNTIASAYFSTAFGYTTQATGTFSTAFGQSTSAISFGEVAIGLYNTTYTANDADNYDSADRLFVIGNGTSDANRSDALIIYKNGDTEVNGNLTISGTLSSSNTAFTSESGITVSKNNTDDFVFGVDSINYSGSGTETKFFFDNDKGAFRAGAVAGDDWNTDKLGIYSIGLGFDTKADGNYTVSIGYDTNADGDYSTALGFDSDALGDYSTAFGSGSGAGGDYSTAFGSSTDALGHYSTAFGYQTNAIGDYSTAFGQSVKTFGQYSIGLGRSLNAASYGETVIGYYNTSYTANSTSSPDTSDRLFVIGNGTSSTRSDALIIYKSGNATLQGDLTANGTFYTSDIRLKEDIKVSQYGLSDILKINVRDYHFKKDKTRHLHTGFLAQQLHSVFPHAVRQGGYDENINPWRVDYASMTPLLVKGIQEQQAIIEQQQQEINDLKAQVAKINQLEAALQQLQANIQLSKTTANK